MENIYLKIKEIGIIPVVVLDQAEDAAAASSGQVHAFPPAS